jgi:hypothetical protein
VVDVGEKDASNDPLNGGQGSLSIVSAPASIRFISTCTTASKGNHVECLTYFLTT